mmetsp:Transcript_73299/g.118246  ORF Transcript_73299/g.118246 Transcript_73299/m.118246 type:complete len:212 (+) Transcript_73299:288-923(+)
MDFLMSSSNSGLSFLVPTATPLIFTITAPIFNGFTCSSPICLSSLNSGAVILVTAHLPELPEAQQPSLAWGPYSKPRGRFVKITSRGLPFCSKVMATAAESSPWAAPAAALTSASSLPDLASSASLVAAAVAAAAAAAAATLMSSCSLPDLASSANFIAAACACSALSSVTFTMPFSFTSSSSSSALTRPSLEPMVLQSSVRRSDGRGGVA